MNQPPAPARSQTTLLIVAVVLILALGAFYGSVNARRREQAPTIQPPSETVEQFHERQKKALEQPWRRP